MAIQKTTNEELQKIMNRSALSLPDRPSDYGMKPSDIRQALTMPIFGDTHSVLAELNRVVDELNALMDGEQGADGTLITTAQTIKGAINELKAKITSAQSGTYTTLTTTAQTILEAINELNQAIGTLDTKVDDCDNMVLQKLYEQLSALSDELEGEIESAVNTAEVYSDDRLSAHAAEFSNRLLLKADLVDGKVPAAQLPSFVDDVLEYDSILYFPETGESGKIYIAKNTNKTYRWGGSSYAEISESLALGETSDTAYAGNKGKANAEAIASLQTAVADRYTKAQIDTMLSAYLLASASATETEMTEILAVLS